jgi:hypothetical protein
LVRKIDVLESLFGSKGMTANLDGEALKKIEIAEPLPPIYWPDRDDTVIVVTEDDTTVSVEARRREG